MRGEAMTRLCAKLSDLNISLSELTALEFFAREGNWQTKSYSDLVKCLYAWEINPCFEHKLKLNHPKAFINIGNSFDLAKDPCYKSKFDFIVFDNPQGIYDNYCEHFEAIDLTKSLLSDFGIIIFNVNKKPFNYDPYSEWAIRRNKFYGQESSILTSKFIIQFYTKYFNELNYFVHHCFEEYRNNEYLSYIVLVLEKQINII
tara:strand:- start:3846 stop:4451 length:606 start_codon:yes stop_codon:yes gene_type:complete